MMDIMYKPIVHDEQQGYSDWNVSGQQQKPYKQYQYQYDDNGMMTMMMKLNIILSLKYLSFNKR